MQARQHPQPKQNSDIMEKLEVQKKDIRTVIYLYFQPTRDKVNPNLYNGVACHTRVKKKKSLEVVYTAGKKGRVGGRKETSPLIRC